MISRFKLAVISVFLGSAVFLSKNVNGQIPCSSSSSLPLQLAYGHSLYEALYTADQVPEEGIIHSVSFQKCSGSFTGPIERAQLYLKESNLQELTYGKAAVSDYTLVYEGALSNSFVSGQIDVTLQHKFPKSSSKGIQLLLFIDVNNISSLEVPKYAVEQTTGNQARSAASAYTDLTSSMYVKNKRLLIEFGSASAQSADVAVLDYVQPPTFCEPGEHDLRISFQNKGSTVLNSATFTTSINGIKASPFYWTGSLQPQEVKEIRIGTAQFQVGQSYLFDITVSDPNNETDANVLDNSLQIGPISSALYGVKTIGGNQADYSTIQAAVNDLIDRGICASVVFKLNSGTYDESITIPEIMGASMDRTITFESATNRASDVIWKTKTSFEKQHVLMLDGADFIYINKLTFNAEELDPSAFLGPYGNLIVLQNEAQHNRIAHSILHGVSSSNSTTDAVAILLRTGQKANHYTQILHNTIYNGNYAIRSYRKNGATYQKGLVIEGNTILMDNSGYAGICLHHNNAFIVHDNTIKITNTLWSTQGVEFHDAIGGIQVTNNVIVNNYGSTGIHLISIESSGTERGLIANNMVTVKGRGNPADVTGIDVYLGSKNLDFIHNTVLIESTNYVSTCFDGGIGTGLRLMNNVFTNKGKGYAATINYNNLVDPSQSDYNCFYTASGALVSSLSFTGYANNLNQLKAKTVDEEPIEIHSVQVKPQFVSSDDLHLLASNNLAAGLYNDRTTKDIDDEIRPQKPTLGADETGKVACGVSSTLVAVNQVGCLNSCDGQLTIDIVGGNSIYSYQWSHNNELTASSASGLCAGIYSVEVTDENQCSFTLQHQFLPGVDVQAIPFITASKCTDKNGEIAFDTGGEEDRYAFSWKEFPEVRASKIEDLPSGIYEATLTNSSSCSKTFQLNISDENGPQVAVEIEHQTAEGMDDGQLLLKTTNGTPPYHYLWVPDVSKTHEAFQLSPQEYNIRITDKNECSTTIKAKVNAFTLPKNEGEQDVLGIPTVFSPTQGFTADDREFRIKTTGEKSFHLQIYDRWGQLVFETNNKADAWNGQYKGKELASAVYFFKVNVVFKSGRRIEKSGDISLIR